MAEPFNELDVQNEREEITVQARYTLFNGTLPTHGATVQPQHGTITKRVKRTLPVLTVQLYTHGTSTKRGAMVQPQHGTNTNG